MIHHIAHVTTSVVRVYHLLGYTYQIQVGYYLFSLPYFFKPIYPNKMHTQRYKILEKYTHFITLDKKI